MFLHQLQEEQKKSFLALAIKTIAADGVKDPREENAILAMRREMGLWAETRLPQGSVEELAAVFDDQKSQRILMMELLGLVYADEKYQRQEQRILRGLAKLFGLEEEEAGRMENWVLRQMELNREAAGLLT